MSGVRAVSKVRGGRCRSGVLSTQLSATLRCTLSWREIICLKTRESLPEPSGDSRRSTSSTVG
eukprot:3622429-Pleurochrysis_carterae.AAC.1